MSDNAASTVKTIDVTVALLVDGKVPDEGKYIHCPNCRSRLALEEPIPLMSIADVLVQALSIGKQDQSIKESMQYFELSQKVKNAKGLVEFTPSEQACLKEVAKNIRRADAMAQAFGWLL